MKKLHLLFTKDGLVYQLSKSGKVLEENSYFLEEGNEKSLIDEKLDEILSKDFSEISVISALNQFTLMPAGFSQHDLANDLIGLNSAINKEDEEMMLSVNKKYEVQFYYTLPKNFYQKIKNLGKPVRFNFSGEKFLNTLHTKGKKEIHINLYHNQCEFFALEKNQVLLYNNLDVNSEVDFLYFIMFTLKKIGFSLEETVFYAYGETIFNETFISELQKFVGKVHLVFDNVPKKNFILKI